MPHRVFVYGSLLRGLHNHHLLQTAKLVKAPARTAADSYVLVDSGSGFPFALSAARAGEAARAILLGEVYEVSDAVLAQLDALEGHPDWYKRSQRKIEGEDEPAWIYLMEDAAQLAAIRRNAARYLTVAAGDWRAHLRETSWPATRRTAAEDAGPHTVFSYGSNGVAQLRERVQNPTLTAARATLPDAVRVFAGWSSRWGGAVASVVPSHTGLSVRGSVTRLSAAELKLLDGFEQVHPGDPYAKGGMYRRQDVEVRTEGGGAVPALMYVMNDLKWQGPPSAAYLAACRTHLSDFWDGDDAAVEVRDGTGELRASEKPTD